MKKIVVLTGAGISRESGLQTFRDGDGLWEGYNVQDVATPDAWRRDAELVQRFYNERRKAALKAKPNKAHLALAKLEERYSVEIITQNIDDLHERAGSSTVLHLHGEIVKSQSTVDPSLVYSIEGPELKMGDKCEKGSQLRPFIVWFGEAVPMMDVAIQIAEGADIFIVIGTSLVVYPAASLIEYAPSTAPLYIIDPSIPNIPFVFKDRLQTIEAKASEGVPKLVSELLND